MDESAGLENRYGGNLIVGSNPTLSATFRHGKGPQILVYGPFSLPMCTICAQTISLLRCILAKSACLFFVLAANVLPVGDVVNGLVRSHASHWPRSIHCAQHRAASAQ